MIIHFLLRVSQVRGSKVLHYHEGTGDPQVTDNILGVYGLVTNTLSQLADIFKTNILA